MSEHLIAVTGGGNTSPDPPKVRSRDEVMNYLHAQLNHLRVKREECNVFFPDDQAKTVRYQKKAERQLLVAVGNVMGAAGMAYVLGHIDHGPYEQIHQEAINELAPRVVGVTGG